MIDDEVKNMLRAGLVQQQLTKLDEDLSLHVVLSALSLNSEKIFKTMQLMGWLQAERALKKADKKISDAEKESFEEASQSIFPTFYSERSQSDDSQ